MVGRERAGRLLGAKGKREGNIFEKAFIPKGNFVTFAGEFGRRL
jgi:hypothetical protein